MVVVVMMMMMMSPTRSCRPLADVRARADAGGEARPQQYRDNRTTGIPDISSPVKNFPSCEIFAIGGGLLVAPINAPHLLIMRCPTRRNTAPLRS